MEQIDNTTDDNPLFFFFFFFFYSEIFGLCCACVVPEDIQFHFEIIQKKKRY